MGVEEFILRIRSLSSEDFTIVVLTLLILYVVYKMILFIVEWTTIREVTAVVIKKERIYYPNKRKSQYIIFTSEGVLENVDSFAWVKFNSSDIYASLKEGETYVFRVCNFRIRVSSSYPNIIKAAPLEGVASYNRGN